MNFASTALWISSGIVVWVLHFGTIYGVTALACARGWHAMIMPVIIAASAVAVAAVLAIIVASLRRRGEFEQWLAATLAGFALVAIVYEALPVFIVKPCA